MAAAPEIPESLWRLLADVGPRWAQDVPGNVRRMVDAFSPLLAHAPKDGVQVVTDLAYGEDPRQQLDVFTTGRSGARPVVLFLHGGAFVDGHRNRSDEIYANVLYYFARQGCVGVNMEYRLAPANVYPSGTLDVAAAVEWVRRHIGDYGGDPQQIYLMGHSAGAAHAASYAYDRRYQPADGPGLAGLIVVSGRVRADNGADNPNARKVEAYYGTDASRYDDCSPVSHVDADSVPTMVAFAEYENPLIDLYCLELAHRLAVAKRRAPRVAYARGHNHTSIIAQFNTAEDRLGTEIMAFMRDRAQGTVR
ncbi:MAG TPA: alpha/beta hydrolase [Bordetella sp.]|nr:alpha/beta hydrolase [Bordetella sp.]